MGEIKTIKPQFEKCPHCQFIATLCEVPSNREYWIITEIFVYLHNGKDYCEFSKNQEEIKKEAKDSIKAFRLRMFIVQSRQSRKSHLMNRIHRIRKRNRR